MMIEERSLSPSQIKWMLVGSLLGSVLLVALLASGMASAQSSDEAMRGKAVFDH